MSDATDDQLEAELVDVRRRIRSALEYGSLADEGKLATLRARRVEIEDELERRDRRDK